MADKLLSALAGEGAVFNSLSFKRRYRGEYLPPCGYRRTGQCTGQEDEKKALSVSALFSDDKKTLWWKARITARRLTALAGF